ncbi:ROK family transcriptional regulator [Cellulomonas bogoriensis]|uniref:Transcriptional regulator n=1 Tax=Cellulomonas bogoriensis 69B4 = DSM 16987 TaxID=1386082 RepID=A0A0A0BP19_9CELL|nr:ROK family transcriptional regulator [Cellulomonas bogoriensis]KGM08819.1 transcriptional regulator [Cellulomonas bogoriensis 69B4 = DSM 16987]
MASKRAPSGSQTSLREANRERIVRVVQQRGSLTQVELAGVTGLSAAAVSNIVKELVAAGVLTTSPTSRSGRRAQEVSLARNLGLVAGVHFADRTLRVVLADVTQRVVADQRLPLAPDHRPDVGLDRTALLVEEMLDALDTSRSELLGVGVGLPAPVDQQSGSVSGLGLLRGWDGVDVPAVLAERLGVQVLVDNDANLGALAEARLGAGEGARHVAFVRVDRGIGLGLVVDGAVVRGRAGAAGEVGHIRVTAGGPLCRCGNRGCLETVAGAGAVLDRLHRTHGHLAVRDVLARAGEGDVACSNAVAEAAEALAGGLASVVAVTAPDVIIVGGELATAGEVYLEPLRAALVEHTLPTAGGPVQVRPPALGSQAEVKGAVALALDAYRVGSPAGLGAGLEVTR